MKSRISFVLLIAVSLLVISCASKEEVKPKIALSKGAGSEGYEQYGKWFNSIDPNFEYIDLYHLNLDEALALLEECFGLVLTGGPDVHPDYYGRGYDTVRCQIDLWRDTLEFKLIEKARAMQLPIFGICRGEQILNVAFGGSLIVDIPDDYETYLVHRYEVPDSAYHQIEVQEGSLLHRIAGVTNGIVNTNHHQAVEILADDFIATAFTPDGLIEAIEWEFPDGKPFLLGVQWHPERMDDNNPFAKPLGEAFLKAASEFHLQKSGTVKK